MPAPSPAGAAAKEPIPTTGAPPLGIPMPVPPIPTPVPPIPMPVLAIPTASQQRRTPFFPRKPRQRPSTPPIRNLPLPARPTTSCPSRLRGSSPPAQSPETARPPAARKRTPWFLWPTRIWKSALTSAHIPARPPRNAVVRYIGRFYLRRNSQSTATSNGNGVRNTFATFISTITVGHDFPASMHPTISRDMPAACASAYRLKPRASRTAHNRLPSLTQTRCDNS